MGIRPLSWGCFHLASGCRYPQISLGPLLVWYFVLFCFVFFFFFVFVLFFAFLGIAQVDITFSVRKEGNLTSQFSAKYLMTMNLVKFATPELISRDIFLLFVFEEAIGNAYFLPVLCSTTKSSLLRIYLGGNPFAFVETDIHYQYTLARSRVSSPCQFQVFSRRYLQGSLNRFPDFFRMRTFIDSTHMKL